MKTTDQQKSYLRARELCIGDILLTGSTRLSAKRPETLGIQVATLSRWTHAGIVCTRTGVLQATSFGDFAFLDSLPVVQATDGEPLLEVQAELIKLLRPTSAALSAWKPKSNKRPAFGDEIAANVLAYLGRDYATQSRMAQFIPWSFRPIAKALMAKLSEDSKASIILKGVCCSELVEMAYHDAGLPITNAKIKLISPATIARSGMLREVPHAVRLAPALTASSPSLFPSKYIEGYLNSDVVDPAVSDAMTCYSSGARQAAVQQLDHRLTDVMKPAAAELEKLYDYESNLINNSLL